MARKGKGSGRSRTGTPSWSNIPRENAKWEAYYKKLAIIPDDSEFEQFKQACQKDLPLTFRITGTTKHAMEVRESCENQYISDLQNIVWDGQNIPPPKNLPFYPHRLAWQVDVGKQVIRKNQQFARFQRFLVVETAVGNISRQEAVSMIPPLVLDVESHHQVLDMCAAPGSKTSQLVEALHSNDRNSSSRPTGFVVANDSDYKRSHMLIHQVKRLNSPNLVVTNHDAQLFPKVRMNHSSSPYLKFDRILCDVPCSGDGTMRKNINVWKDWGPGNGLGLHPLQVNILLRGIQLLKPGGRLVYSTCSLNPIENEAVVAQALRQYPNLKLVDASDRLPGLVRNKGMTSWEVQAKTGDWYKEYSEERPHLPQSLFAPATEQEALDMGLDRCIRVYPHQQNTGGFFIAVLSKGDEIPNNRRKRAASAEVEGDDKRIKSAANDEEKADTDAIVSTTASSATEQASNEKAEPPVEQISNEKQPETAAANTETSAEAKEKPEKLPRDCNEEPFTFLNPNHPTLDECWKFYGINEEFPKDSLLVRNATGEPVRTIYYVAPTMKPVLELNPAMRFVHAGIKLFVQQKSEDTCKWRVQSEGVELLYPFVGQQRVVRASSLDTLKTLCLEPFPKFEGLEKIDAQLKDQVTAVSEGCVFLVVPRGDNEDDHLLYPMWRGKASVNIMLPKQDGQEVLHRLFGIENVKGEAAKTEQATKSEEPEDVKDQEEVEQ